MFPRALLASGALLVVFSSCKAPDASGLFQPYDPANSAGGSGSGAGGGFSLPPLGEAPPVDAGDGFEGQGGALPLTGNGGSDGVSGRSMDAGPADAGDAGPLADAGAQAPRCSDNPERCDGLDNDCDGAADEAGTCATTCDGFALGGRGYMFCSDSVARTAAVERCALEGMRLAWIETPQENASLVDSIEAADVPASDSEEILTQIGGSDSGSEGSWSWRGSATIPNGAQFWQGTAAANGGDAVGGAYTNWSDTEPNDTDGDEDCAVMSVLGNNNRAPGNWDDRNCTTALPFVCEVP